MRTKNEKLLIHQKWLSKAALLAQKCSENGGSPHPTVKVGAIFVGPDNRIISQAVNRLARGIDPNGAERCDNNGSRSLWINCAEQMALAQAVRRQKSLKGARLYVTLEPCAICAGLLAECGIKEIIVPTSSRDFYAKLKKKWKKSIEIGREKLGEAGVKVTFIELDMKNGN